MQINGVKMTIKQYKSGLRLVLNTKNDMDIVSFRIFINAGSANEQKDEYGIAHFLEHMSFKGTSKRTSLQISEEIEDVGGHSNAYTSREFTAYYAKMMKEDAELAVDVLTDSIKNSIFTL